MVATVAISKRQCCKSVKGASNMDSPQQTSRMDVNTTATDVLLHLSENLVQNNYEPAEPAAESVFSSSTQWEANYQRIIQHFLTGQNLRKVFAHLCNHSSGKVTDPISDVVHMMLTCPVQMIISEVRGMHVCANEHAAGASSCHDKCRACAIKNVFLYVMQVGVALFKDQPNALFPFSEMNKNQRYYVEQVVMQCLRQYEILSHNTNHIVMQMGWDAFCIQNRCNSFRTNRLIIRAAASLQHAAVVWTKKEPTAYRPWLRSETKIIPH